MPENTPSTAAETAAEPGASPESTEHDAAYWQAEAEKWKAQSRKNEAAKKENASKLKEYEDWKASQLTEHERAIEAARSEGYEKGRSEGSKKLATTAFLAAAKGRVKDAQKVLSNVDVLQFLTEDGDPDDSAIAEFLDAIAPEKAAEEKTAEPQGGLFEQVQGSRSGGALPLNGDPLLQRVNQILGIR